MKHVVGWHSPICKILPRHLFATMRLSLIHRRVWRVFHAWEETSNSRPSLLASFRTVQPHPKRRHAGYCNTSKPILIQSNQVISTQPLGFHLGSPLTSSGPRSKILSNAVLLTSDNLRILSLNPRRHSPAKSNLGTRLMFAVAHYPRKQRRYYEICVGFSDLVRLKRDEAITNGHCEVGES